MSQPSFERDPSANTFLAVELGSTPGEVVSNHDALLSSAVGRYDAVVSGHANAYSSHVTLIRGAGAPDLFEGMARVVDNTMFQAYDEISKLVDYGAQELERLISTHDADVLRNLRIIAQDESRGIGSPEYQGELGRATHEGRPALGKIMDRDCLVRSLVQAQDPSVGFGLSLTQQSDMRRLLHNLQSGHH